RRAAEERDELTSPHNRLRETHPNQLHRVDGGNAANSAPYHGELLIRGALDADPSLVDKILDVLIGPAEQIALDNERTATDRLDAALPEIDASHWLFSRTRLALGACPAVRAVARSGL